MKEDMSHVEVFNFACSSNALFTFVEVESAWVAHRKQDYLSSIEQVRQVSIFAVVRR